MSKRLLEIYALAVCFVSMVCLSIFSGIFLYSLVELSFPSVMAPRYIPPPFPPSYIEMANPAFTGQNTLPASKIESEETTEEKKKKQEEEQKQYEERFLESARLESIKSAIRSVIIIFITSIVFFFHWRIAKKVRAEGHS